MALLAIWSIANHNNPKSHPTFFSCSRSHSLGYKSQSGRKDYCFILALKYIVFFWSFWCNLISYLCIFVLFCEDFDPQVNYYWLRGERTIPAGHRSGRIEPMRFQIDDKPHSQIRIPQQLPGVGNILPL